ncbi:MAG TPA: sigma-70 family RNA polymerase sigma factor [Planctomycetota bacterium]
MPETPSVATELITHSGALRRLARALVGSSDADDLVQDLAVRALRSPPPAPHGLFSWLATVMRNLAANRRRDDHCRSRREAEAGRNGDGPPADAEASRRDTVRAMADALWALPEPYQATLVQRYFEELPPSRIAKRSGVPVATVKSRLQRGLELLRQALERRDGRAWRTALAPAFGLPVCSPWLVPTLSMMSMSTFSKCGAVLAACAIAALTWWGMAADVVAPSPIAAVGAADAERAPLAKGGVEERAARDPVAGAAAAALPELAQPYEFELRGRAVGADGLPIGGAHVALAPPACALALSEQTDAEGRVVVKWRARAEQLTMAVGLALQGDHTSLQQITVTAGVPADVSFVAGIAPLPSQVHVDAFGRQVVTMPECSQGKADCTICHEAIKGPRLFEVRGAMRVGLHPDAVFGDRLAVAPPDPQVVTLDDVGAWERTSGAMLHGPSRHRIEGRVFGPDGNPAVRVAVQFLRSDARSGTHTDARGFFWMTKPPGEGPVTVRAGGGPEGLATLAIEVAGERTTVPDLILDTGRTLRGRVRGSDGKNLNGARVEYLAPPGSDGDVATAGPDGTFAFANLPPGPGRLLVWGVAGEKFPIAEEPSVLPHGGDVDLDLRQRAAVNGGLRVFVRGHDGGAPPDLEVRAWQQQTRRGAFLDRREDGAFHAHGLMAGFYQIEIGALATGWRDLGVHWVDGTAVADLGTVSLPPPARCRIEADANLDGLELYASRADLVVRADEVAPWTRDLLLPAGRWLALWKRDGELVMREVDLSASATVTMRDDR